MRIFNAVPIAIAISLFAYAAFSQAPNFWSAWIAGTVQLVRTKDTGITDASQLRDQLCPKQQEETNIQDCKARLNTIIERRTKERDLLLDMIEKSVTLPDKQRDLKIPTMNNAYNETDARTTAMVSEFATRYPH